MVYMFVQYVGCVHMVCFVWLNMYVQCLSVVCVVFSSGVCV